MSSAVFHINRSQQKYYLATSGIGYLYGPTAEPHAKKETLEQYFQDSKHNLLSQREN